MQAANHSKSHESQADAIVSHFISEPAHFSHTESANMTDSARWKATVYVGGLAPVVTNSHVLDAFIPFGEIVEVQVPKSDGANSAEPHRGFAYVEYEDESDAKEAIDNMDQSEFFGKVIKCSQAKAPKSADEGLGSKKAVWEQVRYLSKVRRSDILTSGRRVGLHNMLGTIKILQRPARSRLWMVRDPIRCRD